MKRSSTLTFLSLSVDKVVVIHRFGELSTDFEGWLVEYAIQLVTLFSRLVFITTLLSLYPTQLLSPYSFGPVAFHFQKIHNLIAVFPLNLDHPILTGATTPTMFFEVFG